MIMNDLISREALIKEMEHGKHPEFYDGQDIANWQMQCIENAPAVDAEPVRHGEWIYQDGEIMLCKTCSLCRCESFDLDGEEYCPYCGAKMDLEDEQ